MASVWSLLTSANKTSTKILKKCHVETETVFTARANKVCGEQSSTY